MIEFEGLTDITYLNLDELVNISENFMIEVYPDDKKKDKIGEKLNKPAVLTFVGCKFWKGKRSEDVAHKKIELKLKNIAEKEVKYFL